MTFLLIFIILLSNKMKRGTYMSTEKIVITTNLRLDIIERRKEKGISSYDLSEQVGNGHSKFWLQNLESG